MPLYDLSVSAGTGVYLDDEAATEIYVPNNEKTKSADFALRINGNSMEPKDHDGDIVLVEGTDCVEVGELGIFVLDGNGYFKMNGNMIEYWGASLDNKTHTVLARFENWTGNLGGIIDGFVTGSINTEAVVSAEAYKELP